MHNPDSFFPGGVSDQDRFHDSFTGFPFIWTIIFFRHCTTKKHAGQGMAVFRHGSSCEFSGFMYTGIRIPHETGVPGRLQIRPGKEN